MSWVKDGVGLAVEVETRVDDKSDRKVEGSGAEREEEGKRVGRRELEGGVKKEKWEGRWMEGLRLVQLLRLLQLK